MGRVIKKYLNLILQTEPRYLDSLKRICLDKKLRDYLFDFMVLVSILKKTNAIKYSIRFLNKN